MIKPAFIFLIVTFSFFLVAGQNNYQQTLLEAQEYFDSNPTKSDHLLNEILDADSTQVDLSTRITTLRLLGVRGTFANQFDQATSYFNRALNLTVYIADDNTKELEQAKIFLNQGKNLLWQSQYDTALSMLLKARETFEIHKVYKEQAKAINDLAIIYIQYSNENEKGLAAFKEALALYQLADELGAMAKTMQNLGQIYNMMGSNDSALYYVKQSNQLVEELKDYRSLAVGKNMLGAIFNDLEAFDSSEFYFRQAIDLDILNQDSIGLLYDYFQLSETLNAVGKYQEASKYAALAYEHSRSMHLKIGAASSLVEVYSNLNNYKSALHYHKAFKALSDSLRREDQRKTVSELQTKYETIKKEKEITETRAALEREQGFKQFLLVLIGVIALFSAIAILLLIQRFRIKRALLSQEIDTLRAQINSVFGGGVEVLNLTLEAINKGLIKPLSEREFEILKHALSEKNNREIAETVFLSVSTVKFHLRNIYEKLGVTNRKEALEMLISKS